MHNHSIAALAPTIIERLKFADSAGWVSVHGESNVFEESLWIEA